MKDARVVCRQLGYQDAVKTLQRNTFPSGSGLIWLAYVACNGNEQNITNCTHSPWGVHYCSHYQDAGVECSRTGMKFVNAGNMYTKLISLQNKNGNEASKVPNIFIVVEQGPRRLDSLVPQCKFEVIIDIHF